MDATAISSVIAALLTFAGVVIANRYTARTARSASATTAEIESKKADTAAWKDLNEALSREIRRVREDSERDRERDRAEFERRLGSAMERIESLEREVRHERQERRQDRARVEALTQWGRAVVALLRDAGIEFPRPPHGIEDTDPGRHMLPVRG